MPRQATPEEERELDFIARRGPRTMTKEDRFWRRYRTQSLDSLIGLPKPGGEPPREPDASSRIQDIHLPADEADAKREGQKRALRRMAK